MIVVHERPGKERRLLSLGLSKRIASRRSSIGTEDSGQTGDRFSCVPKFFSGGFVTDSMTALKMHETLNVFPCQEVQPKQIARKCLILSYTQCTLDMRKEAFGLSSTLAGPFNISGLLVAFLFVAFRSVDPWVVLRMIRLSLRIPKYPGRSRGEEVQALVSPTLLHGYFSPRQEVKCL
jgi:hypothetical protein